MTETPRHAFDRGPVEELQDALNKDRNTRLFMKEVEVKDDTVVLTEETLIAAQNELRATDGPLSNAQLMFIRKAMKTWEASLLKKERAHIRGAVADIIRC